MSNFASKTMDMDPECGCCECCAPGNVEVFHVVVTGISTGFGAGEVIGQRYAIESWVLEKVAGWSQTKLTIDGSFKSASLIFCGNDSATATFIQQTWWGGNGGVSLSEGPATNQWDCDTQTAVIVADTFSPPFTNWNGYYTSIEVTITP